MNHYHVITPLGRLTNTAALIRNLESQRRPQFDLTWHPIFDEGLPFDLAFPQHWITKGYCPPCKPFWQFWAHAMNRFLRYVEPNDFYCVLNDDDLYEPAFFEHLDLVRPNEVMIVSMKRGHHIPAGVEPERAHGTNTLEAKPESVQVGHIGAEQLICRGHIWGCYEFNDTIAADGERICEIVGTRPDCSPVTYVPDAFVWFNRLEPGRYDHDP